jgi:endonuclease YncB( thermonuclease family)
MPDYSFDFPVLGVREVHDGDTWRLDLDVGFEHTAFPWLRLKDYSCPELSDPGGKEAREYSRTLLVGAVEAEAIWVRTFKRKGYEDQKKSFARYLAEVYIGSFSSRESDPPNPLGEIMVNAGYARRGAFMH